MTRSKAFSIALCSAIACCFLTSCNEQKRLKSEIEAAQARVKEMRAEYESISDQGGSFKDGRDTLKNHPVMRKGQRAVEAEISNLEASVEDLEKRKSALQTEVETLGKELSEYKIKNL